MRRFGPQRLVPRGFWQSNGSLQCNNRVYFGIGKIVVAVVGMLGPILSYVISISQGHFLPLTSYQRGFCVVLVIEFDMPEHRVQIGFGLLLP
jgi:hypothetical protein